MRLTINREKSFLLNGYRTAVYIDGKKAGTIRNGGSISIELPQGRHEIELRMMFTNSFRMELLLQNDTEISYRYSNTYIKTGYYTEVELLTDVPGLLESDSYPKLSEGQTGAIVLCVFFGVMMLFMAIVHYLSGMA